MAGFPGMDELFEGRHFDREIIVLCVRWYLRFKLSFRVLVQIALQCESANSQPFEFVGLYRSRLR